MEMDFNKQDEEKYLKGYNRGEFFAEFDRELLNELTAINSNDPYLVGVRQGKDDFDRAQKDKENGKLPKWLQQDINKNEFNKVSREPSKDKNNDRDR